MEVKRAIAEKLAADAEEKLFQRGRPSLCVVCRQPTGFRRQSPARAFENPIVGAVHQACLLKKQSYVTTTRNRKGSKQRMLLGPLRDQLLQPVPGGV